MPRVLVEQTTVVDPRRNALARHGTQQALGTIRLPDRWWSPANLKRRIARESSQSGALAPAADRVVSGAH